MKMRPQFSAERIPAATEVRRIDRNQIIGRGALFSFPTSQQENLKKFFNEFPVFAVSLNQSIYSRLRKKLGIFFAVAKNIIVQYDMYRYLFDVIFFQMKKIRREHSTIDAFLVPSNSTFECDAARSRSRHEFI